MKRVLAVLAMVAGLSGTFAAVAPSASAIPFHVRIDGDTDELFTGICIRINITIFGNTIGTGPNPICLT